MHCVAVRYKSRIPLIKQYKLLAVKAARQIGTPREARSARERHLVACSVFCNDFMLTLSNRILPIKRNGNTNWSFRTKFVTVNKNKTKCTRRRDSRLRPSAANWRSGRNICVVFDYGSFVHKYITLHCRQSRTDPRTSVTCTENLVKCGHVFLRYTSGQTDRQKHTNTLVAIGLLRLSAEGKVIIESLANCIKKSNLFCRSHLSYSAASASGAEITATNSL